VGASITEGLALPALLACGTLAGGCQPNLGAPQSLVSAPRILAVSADPAESDPMSSTPMPVRYTVLVADSDLKTFPSGEPTAAPVDWAFCKERKPLSELTDIAATCFTYGQSFLMEIGQGLTVSGTLPADGCMNFGPEPPSTAMGTGRPTDPDPTGGYYQPVRLILPTSGAPILGAEESRISCGLGTMASGAIDGQFSMAYKLNTNPVLSGVGVVPATGSGPVTPIPPDDVTSPGFSVHPGERIVLQASWPTCPGPPMQGCGAETFPNYDPATQTLVMQREALTVAWYTTAGAYDVDATPIASGDDATTANNGFTAPNAAGPVLLWVVLLDDRGGTTWQRYRLDVM
jgi:hypothetical protein